MNRLKIFIKNKNYLFEKIDNYIFWIAIILNVFIPYIIQQIFNIYIDQVLIMLDIPLLIYILTRIIQDEMKNRNIKN